MHCPFCGHADTKVTDSRLAGEGRQVRRRRECLACAERFTTFEAAELLMPQIVKSDRSREPFDEAKLRSGMLKALEKRPVAGEAAEEAVQRICHKLRGMGEFFGTKQSGLPALRFANIVRDPELLEVARSEAAAFIANPPSEEALRRAVQYLRTNWQRRYGLVQVG